MSFEAPTGLVHVYRYHPDGSDLPDPIGKANTIAAGLLYERGEIDGLFLSSGPLKAGRLSLSEVSANQIRQDFPQIPQKSIIVAKRAATTYGEVRDYRDYLVQHGNPSMSLVNIGARDHQQYIEPFFNYFFPGQEVKYFNFEDVLRASPYPGHQEFIANLISSPDYRNFQRYMLNAGLIYRASKQFPAFNEFIELGPVAHLKHWAQWAVIDMLGH